MVWTLKQLLEEVPASRSTVERWIKEEGLPVVRITPTSRRLFRPQSVHDWLESHERQEPAAAERQAAAAVASDAVRLAELRQSARRPRSRRTPPPPVKTAGSRERLRGIRGAR